VLVVGAGGKPEDLPYPRPPANQLRPGDEGEGEREGGPPDHAQKELPLSCSGEEACYAGVDWSCVNLVWEYC